MLSRGVALRAVRRFSAAPRALAYLRETEILVRERLDRLPSPLALYHNADGLARELPESELKTLGELQVLAAERKLTLWEHLRLQEPDLLFYLDNTAELEALQIIPPEDGSAGQIVDKIPYEDATTGELKWKVIRGNQREGWEPYMYYGFVPLLIGLLLAGFFKTNKSMAEWSEDELRLRVLEAELGSEEAAKAALRNGDKTPEEIAARDRMIVERIVGGEYDRLKQIRK